MSAAATVNGERLIFGFPAKDIPWGNRSRSIERIRATSSLGRDEVVAGAGGCPVT